jgi:NAD(P)-dependent dehydrogenase (short-subunit alcohol dehydrogenase family)
MNQPNQQGRLDVLLENKNAVIYGGGGKVGGAVTRAFAREGAKVFLAGRTLGPLDAGPRRSALREERPRRRWSTL